VTWQCHLQKCPNTLHRVSVLFAKSAAVSRVDKLSKHGKGNEPTTVTTRSLGLRGTYKFIQAFGNLNVGKQYTNTVIKTEKFKKNLLHGTIMGGTFASPKQIFFWERDVSLCNYHPCVGGRNFFSSLMLRIVNLWWIIYRTNLTQCGHLAKFGCSVPHWVPKICGVGVLPS